MLTWMANVHDCMPNWESLMNRPAPTCSNGCNALALEGAASRPWPPEAVAYLSTVLTSALLAVESSVSSRALPSAPVQGQHAVSINKSSHKKPGTVRLLMRSYPRCHSSYGGRQIGQRLATGGMGWGWEASQSVCVCQLSVGRD